MSYPNKANATGPTGAQDRHRLFKLGGAVALILLVMLMVGAVGVASAATNVSPQGTRFVWLYDNWLVTLFRVNLPASGVASSALAVFNLLDLGIMVLFAILTICFYPALKQSNRVWSLVAVSLPLLGIPLFIATSTAGRSALLVSGFIISILMLRSHAFGMTVAFIGIAASAFLFLGGDIATAIFHSSVAVAVLLAIGYVLWELWFLLVALRFFRLGRVQRTTR